MYELVGQSMICTSWWSGQWYVRVGGPAGSMHRYEAWSSAVHTPSHETVSVNQTFKYIIKANHETRTSFYQTNNWYKKNNVCVKMFINLTYGPVSFRTAVYRIEVWKTNTCQSFEMKLYVIGDRCRDMKINLYVINTIVSFLILSLADPP